MKYELQDCEINKKVIVEAPGVAEAMLEYLPWPTLDLKIIWEPTNGKGEVIDNQTGFFYRLRAI